MRQGLYEMLRRCYKEASAHGNRKKVQYPMVLSYYSAAYLNHIVSRSALQSRQLHIIGNLAWNINTAAHFAIIAHISKIKALDSGHGARHHPSYKKQTLCGFLWSLSSLQAIDSCKVENPVILKILKDHKSQLTNSRKFIAFCWIPSHVGIRGNEDADALLKQDWMSSSPAWDFQLSIC